MIVGYTGTREGMTGNQAAVVTTALLKATEGHHGDCIGGDEQFHGICRELAIPVVIHPPEDDSRRAFCTGGIIIRVEPPLPFLIRNRIIVDGCELLLAAPKEDEEPDVARGQGTWSTVRYARRTGKPFRVAWPGSDWMLPL